ncbi:hypothetical protein BGX31_000420 [Mortierella sp. GBA43]|nr:hypothetical protein BGX31_000420 [Mortierella sp. GBA43]
MMELFLVSGLMICSRIERDNVTGQPLFTLTTENTSQFPIPNITGRLRMGKDDNDEGAFEDSPGCHATLLSSTAIVNKKGKAVRTKAKHSIYCKTNDQSEEGQEPPSSPAPKVLLPGMKCVDVFRLTLQHLDDWLILVEVNFKSPGTGKTLSKKHECCVYLVDQCTIKWFSGDVTEAPGREHIVRMMTTLLRQVLSVPVTMGISTGMRFSLESLQSNFLVHGCVTAISEDGQETELEIWSEDNSDEISGILDRVCMELSALRS